MTKEAKLAQKIAEYLVFDEIVSEDHQEYAEAVIRRFIKDAKSESNNE